MPTLEDLGKLVKQRYPGSYDSIPDLQLGQKVQERYPNAYGQFRGSSGDVAKQARKNLANNLQQGAAETQAQDIADVKGEALRQGAVAIGGGVAGLATGGLSFLPALAASGAIGAGVGAVSSMGKAFLGTQNAPKDLGDIASTMGFDAASFAGGEALGRGTGVVLKSMVPKLIARAGATIDKGSRTLDQMYANASNDLFDTVSAHVPEQNLRNMANSSAEIVKSNRGTISGMLPGSISEAIPEAAQTATGQRPEYWVPAGNVLKNIVDDVKKIPGGKTAFTTRFGGRSSLAMDTVDSILKDVATKDGSIGGFQDLNDLIVAQHSFQTAAWKDTGLNRLERAALKKGADNLGSFVQEELKRIPGASALHDYTNEIVKAQIQNSFMADLGERATKLIVGKVIPGAVGGVLGFGVGNRMGGQNAGIKGALVGATIGESLPYVSSLLLQQALKHPEALPVMKKAVELAFEGKADSAAILAARGMMMAGARDTLLAVKDSGYVPPPIDLNPQAGQ